MEIENMMDKIETERTMVDSDGEEYLDIPIEEWKELRRLVREHLSVSEYKLFSVSIKSSILH